MSEHIAHTAICDDVRLLVLQLEWVPDYFRDVWRRHHDVSRLGAITRRADNWSVQVLEHIRKEHQKPVDERDRFNEQKLAFILRALTHRSIDRHMKPVFLHFRNQPDYTGVNICTVYHDVFLLKEIYGGGESGTPFPDGMLDPAIKPDIDGLRRLMETALRQALIEMHTFVPDGDNIHHWLEELFKRQQTFPFAIDHFVRVASEWNPEEVRRYLVETHFYDENEPIVGVLRRLRSGQLVAGGEISAALHKVTEDTAVIPVQYARPWITYERRGSSSRAGGVQRVPRPHSMSG